MSDIESLLPSYPLNRPPRDDIVKALRTAAVCVAARLGPEWQPLAWTLDEAGDNIEALRRLADL
jgi:hypothetical protein